MVIQTGALSGAHTAGGSTVTLAAAPAGLDVGSLLNIGGATPEVVAVASNYVYGSTTVPLTSAMAKSHVDTCAVTWQPVALSPAAGTADALAASSMIEQGIGAYNGATMDRVRSGSALNVTGTSGNGSLLTSRPGSWGISHAPTGAAAKATITKAAGSTGVCHVADAISASLHCDATAQPSVGVALRDGASGTGPVLWSRNIVLPANGQFNVDFSGLNIVGSPATAMSLEFSATGATATQQSVSLQGHEVS